MEMDAFILVQGAPTEMAWKRENRNQSVRKDLNWVQTAQNNARLNTAAMNEREKLTGPIPLTKSSVTGQQSFTLW